MAFRIEFFDRISEIDKDEWNNIVIAAGAPVFYHYDFIAAYERAPLQANIYNVYIVVRDRLEGKALAVVPIYIQDEMDPFGVLTRGFPGFQGTTTRGALSHIWHCYDSRIPTVAESPELVAALCSAMREVSRKWNAEWYGFVDVDESQGILSLLSSAGLTTQKVWERFVLDLSGMESIDDYLKLLRRSARQELRRQHRRAIESGATISFLSPPFEDIEEVVSLCRLTTSRYGTGFYYPAETFGEFLQKAGDNTRIFAIRFNDTLVGAWICFIDHYCFHTWAAGVRYDLTNFSPYYVGFYEAVRFAISTGTGLMEGGRGNGAFKLRYGLRPAPLYAALSSL